MSLITVISGYLCFSKQCYIFVGNTCLNNTILQTSKVEGDLKQNGKAKHSNNIHKSAGSMLVAYCSPPPHNGRGLAASLTLVHLTWLLWRKRHKGKSFDL